MLCQYKDIFGKVGEGVHSYRVLNFAIVDVIVTIIGAYLISRVTKQNFIIVLVLFFILGIILHKFFCVRTTVDKLIFG